MSPYPRFRVRSARREGKGEKQSRSRGTTLTLIPWRGIGLSRGPQPRRERVEQLGRQKPVGEGVARVWNRAQVESGAADADEFRNQYPTYNGDIAGETRKAPDALRTDPVHRARYAGFVAAMVYGEQWAFDDGMKTVTDLVDDTWH